MIEHPRNNNMKHQLKVAEGEELEIKRFYLPSSYKINCPCGNEMEDSFETNYLSYPKVGSMEGRYLVCEKCGKEHEFEIKILSITVEIEVPNKLE